MKCITKVNEYTRNSHSNSYLIGTNRHGRESRLLDGLTLTMDGEQFMIENGQGEIIRQGRTESVFDVYDTMLYRVKADRLQVETEGFSGTFAEYENKFGIGRVDRSIKRKFYAYTERGQNDENAIGIVEYDRKQTFAIHSIYIGESLTNRQRIDCMMEYISELLNANEYANAQAVGFEPKFRNSKYAGIINIWSSQYSPKMEQSKLLFDDAMERKESTSEVFDKPMTYEIQGLFDNEKGA